MNINSLLYNLFIYQNIKINENNIPTDNEILNSEKYRNNNNFVYQLVFSHSDINQDILKQNKIKGDRNCFFRNLSYFYTKDENYYSFFRDNLFQYINNNKDNIIAEYPKIEVDDIIINTEEYIPKIKENKFYGGFFEIGQIKNLIKINIAIHKKEKQKYSNIIIYKYLAYFMKKIQNIKGI